MSSVCHWRTDRPYTRSYSRCQRPCGHRLRERRCLPHARGEPWPWGPWVSLHVMRTRSGDLSHMRGPHLFAGQAIRVFDEECAYRKRADETAARFLQARQTRPGRRGGPSTAFRPAGRQATVTLPAPVPAPQAHRGRGAG